ncbi:leucine-rich repeat receptor-like protein kinase [Platanthera guangdongensis]|uniref:Leucine-rich repeat receptor-like protein kinase n=1 Tax=Platanthera guangdongensis TaxID=2320717 RepID=A0ABR2M8P5_9ASPA
MSTMIPPLFSFFFFLLPLLPCSAFPFINDDILGLIVFKAALKDPHSNLASWSEDDDSPCNWAGVKCDPITNKVSELSLDGFSLSGNLGLGLLQLHSLRRLSLSRNNLSGDLNADLLLRLESIRSVDLSRNSFSGSIPDGFFQQCRSLSFLSLANNQFFGNIPDNVSSCSTLTALNLSSNRLSGSLPGEIWSLNALRLLDLSHNSLTGEIPAGINHMFNLRSVNLRGNQLSGKLPEDFGYCFLLKSIDIGENLLSGNLPSSLPRLSGCTSLRFGSNFFTGEVPYWIGEMKSLQVLDLSRNQFSGWLPSSIGNLQALEKLNLSECRLIGSLPESIGSCKSLLDVDLSHNSLSGIELQELELNSIPIPAGIGIEFNFNSAVRLNAGILSQELELAIPMFGCSIPSSFGELKALEVLDFTGNQFSGSIPSEIGAAISLKALILKRNSLSGAIPADIGRCALLSSLIHKPRLYLGQLDLLSCGNVKLGWDLSENNLTSSIPSTISSLVNIKTVDLSFNKLTGTLPKQLGNLPHLLSFNISHNNFNGDLPTGNFFNTIPPSSVSDNPNLCGAAVNRSCPAFLPKPIVLNPNSSYFNPSSPSSLPIGNLHHKKTILSISCLIAIAAAAIIAVGVVTITVLNRRFQPSASHPCPAPQFSEEFLSQAPPTDANSGKLIMFSGENPEFSAGSQALLNKDSEIGRGGFGAVYKITFGGNGRPVAIKKLNVSRLVKSQEEFEREVKKLGNTQHQNLVKLEGYYWSPSLQLLIYEYATGGSLYSLLHESMESSSLSWLQRFHIVFGIAKSLRYLHSHGLIHYNLKSSNVMLDSCGDPKVGDYGLAKLLPVIDRNALSGKTQSALGYMAPEFGCRNVRINEKCDVYGFGVLVLEIVTGRKPVEYTEDDVVVLCDVLREALDEERVEEYMDGRLCGKFPMGEMISMIKLGLICTSQVPSSRPDMAEVVSILELIRYPQGSPEEVWS